MSPNRLLATTTSKPSGSMFATNFAMAAGSVSQIRSRSMPSTARNPSAWNSACDPVPIRAMVEAPGRASARAAIAEVAEHERVDWSQVHVWWGDERYVDSGSDDRNDKPAAAKLLDRLPFDIAKVHRMPPSDAGFVGLGADDGDGLEAAADSYAAELAAAAPEGSVVPAFDVVLLGLGPDGHCCSLFPNHPGTRVLDKAVIGVRDSPKPPPERLSLTFPALDAAREIWLIASGDGKADAVAAALAPGANREQVPSSGPRGTDGTRWLLDEPAAGKLPAR